MGTYSALFLLPGTQAPARIFSLGSSCIEMDRRVLPRQLPAASDAASNEFLNWAAERLDKWLKIGYT